MGVFRRAEAGGDAHPGFAWPWLLLAPLGLGGFALVTWLVAIRAALPIDGWPRDVAIGWRALDPLWSLISNAANIPLIVIAVGIVGWLLWKGRRRDAVLVIVALALVTAGSEGVKQLVHRPRPPGSDTVVPGVIYSYPSGHELESVAILGIVALLVWRGRVRLLLRLAVAACVAVFVALVAVARVAIDAHYPSDVLAGFLGGIGVLAMMAILLGPDVDRQRAPPAAGGGQRADQANGRQDRLGRAGPLGPEPAVVDEGSLRWRTFLLVAGLAGLIVCLLIVGTLATVVSRQEADALDAVATPFLHGLASPALDAVMNAVSFAGSDVSLLAILAIAGAVLIHAGRRREALFLAVALGGSLVLDTAMKLYFHRPRPALAWAHVLPDYSFPSGHSMHSMVFGLALAIVVWRVAGPRWGRLAVAVAIVAATVVGISRIYLGYHYLTDVAAAFATAILWVAIVVAAFGATDSWWRRVRSATPGG